MDEEVYYAPYFGEVLPNGTLRIPTSGRAPDGEIWDGHVVVAPDHPSDALWLSQINSKAAYHAALDEERRRAREQRRQESRGRRQERQP